MTNGKERKRSGITKQNKKKVRGSGVAKTTTMHATTRHHDHNKKREKKTDPEKRTEKTTHTENRSQLNDVMNMANKLPYRSELKRIESN